MIRVSKLIEKINNWQKNQKMNEVNINFNIKNNYNYLVNINRNNLLKDNQIPNWNNISLKILIMFVRFYIRQKWKKILKKKFRKNF